MTNSMELAIRSAVITSNRDLSKGRDQYSEIEKNALSRAMEWSGNDAGSAAQSSLRSEAIKAALQVLSKAYTAISQQLTDMKNKRVSFDTEVAAGVVTFIKPRNKERGALTIQERVMTNFFSFIDEDQNKAIASYFGIHQSTLEDGRICYSTLPFYSMHIGNAEQTNSRILDNKRKKINIFLKQVPKFLKTITDLFRNVSKFRSWWRSAVSERDNYLNDLRAVRFIMISFANLLWNLQHPVDTRAGLSLDVNKCTEVCQTALICLNQLLNDKSSKSIHELNTQNNQLMVYGRRIESCIESMMKGFQSEEVLGELNFDPICNNATDTLDNINNSIFELIYSYYDPITKESEGATAASDMVDGINDLNRLIQKKPGLLHVFVQPEKPFPALNDPITSIMDVLIIYVHCTRAEREAIYVKLEAIQDDSKSAEDFKNALQKFHHNFIDPIEQITIKKLKVSVWDNHRQTRALEVSIYIAKELMPLISLLLYNDDVNVEVEYNADSENKNDKDVIQKNKKNNANMQIKMINKMAEQKDYYRWSLPLETKLSEDQEKKLAKFLKQQLRFSKLIKLLDYIKEIVKHYRTFLHEEAFLDFLKRCLQKIETEFNLLVVYIKEIEASLSQTRTMTGILNEMERKLNQNLLVCKRVTASIKTLIDNPDFIEKQKDMLSDKFEYIDEQYVQLFNEKSGIASFIRNKSTRIPSDLSISRDSTESRGSGADEQKCEDPHLRMVDYQKFQMLRTLIQTCYNALSYQSKKSEKGWALHNLLDSLNASLEVSVYECNHMVKDLARIALKPRKACFFQAAYAETCSAKPLLKAMKDAKQNDLLSLSTLVLGKQEDLSHETDAQLVHRLKAVHERVKSQSAQLRKGSPGRMNSPR